MGWWRQTEYTPDPKPNEPKPDSIRLRGALIGAIVLILGAIAGALIYFR